MISGGRSLLPEIVDQSDRVGAKSPIYDIFSLVARVSGVGDTNANFITSQT